MSRVLKVLLVMVLATLSLVSSDVIATVNGKDITRQDVNQFVAKSIRGARYSAMNATQKQQVVNQLIDRALYVEVAREEGIEQDREYSKAFVKVKENLMLDVWMKKRLNDILVSDQEIQRYYEQHDRKFMKTASASARHILVSSEMEAKEIIRELLKSRNLKDRFIEFAHSRSTGPSSKNGGDIGWFNKAEMVPEFSNAALALRKGQITLVPVKTQFGYHIIYLTDKRGAGKMEFSKVKESIVSSIKLEKFKMNLENLNKKLKSSARITVK